MRLTDYAVVVFDLDDTLYLERDYVRSGFDAVGAYTASQCRWPLARQRIRQAVLEAVLRGTSRRCVQFRTGSSTSYPTASEGRGVGRSVPSTPPSPPSATGRPNSTQGATNASQPMGRHRRSTHEPASKNRSPTIVPSYGPRWFSLPSGDPTTGSRTHGRFVTSSEWRAPRRENVFIWRTIH